MPRKPAAFYRAATYRPERSVAYLMRLSLQSVRAQADARLAEHGLTHALWAPLYFIAFRDGSTLAEIARELQLDPGATTRTLDKLEHKGLVRRERSSEDRRVVHLRLTAAGERVANALPGVLSEVLNAHLAGFSEAEFQHLEQLLQRFVANGEALREAA